LRIPKVHEATLFQVQTAEVETRTDGKKVKVMTIEGRFEDEGPLQTHFFLAKQDSPAGDEYNAATIQMLRTFVLVNGAKIRKAYKDVDGQVKQDSEQFNILTELKRAMDSTLPKMFKLKPEYSNTSQDKWRPETLFLRCRQTGTLRMVANPTENKEPKPLGDYYNLAEDGIEKIEQYKRDEGTEALKFNWYRRVKIHEIVNKAGKTIPTTWEEFKYVIECPGYENVDNERDFNMNDDIQVEEEDKVARLVVNFKRKTEVDLSIWRILEGTEPAQIKENSTERCLYPLKITNLDPQNCSVLQKDGLLTIIVASQPKKK